MALLSDQKTNLAGIGYEESKEESEKGSQKRKEVLGNWFVSAGRIVMGMNEEVDEFTIFEVLLGVSLEECRAGRGGGRGGTLAQSVLPSPRHIPLFECMTRRRPPAHE